MQIKSQMVKSVSLPKIKGATYTQYSVTVKIVAGRKIPLTKTEKKRKQWWVNAKLDGGWTSRNIRLRSLGGKSKERLAYVKLSVGRTVALAKKEVRFMNVLDVGWIISLLLIRVIGGCSLDARR